MHLTLPIEISSHLKKYKNMESEEELLNELKKNPSDLISFFLDACEDETWTESHPVLIRGILNWLTLSDQNFPFDFLHQVIKPIQKHSLVLRPFIPLDLLLKAKDSETKYPMNSFLLSHHSHYFQRRIFNERRGAKNPHLVLEIPEIVIQLIDEFICTGEIKDLWKIQLQELWTILDHITPMGFFPLVEEIEKVIERYIDRDHVFEFLIKAHRKSLQILQNACIEFINDLELGVRLKITPVEYLSFEFLNYKGNAFEVFDKLTMDITHLVFTNGMAADPHFKTVVNRCPKLIVLDLSDSTAVDFLADLPSFLKGIHLSRCAWINRSALQTLASACPHLSTLDLSSNEQLTYTLWNELLKFKKIVSLDISRCYQMGDHELRIILQACPGLTELNLKDCQKISSEGFFDLGRLLSNLSILNIARTMITDTALIHLMAKCQNLYSLDISRCNLISAKGVLEGVRNCKGLKIIHLSNLNLTEVDREEIQRINPYLNIEHISDY